LEILHSRFGRPGFTPALPVSIDSPLMGLLQSNLGKLPYGIGTPAIPHYAVVFLTARPQNHECGGSKLTRTFPEQYNLGGLKQDNEIQEQTVILGVVEVILKFLHRIFNA
jgi:hypothetical protein